MKKSELALPKVNETQQRIPSLSAYSDAEIKTLRTLDLHAGKLAETVGYVIWGVYGRRLPASNMLHRLRRLGLTETTLTTPRRWVITGRGLALLHTP